MSSEPVENVDASSTIDHIIVPGESKINNQKTGTSENHDQKIGIESKDDHKTVNRSNKRLTKKEREEIDGKAAVGALITADCLDVLKNWIAGKTLPPDPDLKSALITAWKNYYVEKNIPIPAWIQVATVSIVYVAPAFSTPSAKTKAGICIAWMKSKLHRKRVSSK